MMLATVLAGAALVLAGGTVVDGYGNDPIPDGIVVIEGDRILAVGGAGQVVIPDGAEIVSTEGMTVLPGLWDMQADLIRLGHGDSGRWNETYGPLAERVVMPIAARQLLAAGVTSARDVSAPLKAAVRVRTRIRERIVDGPDLYVSGPALRKLAPAGTGEWQWEVSGAQDAWRRVVATAAQQGIPAPGFSSALAYYDGLRAQRLPAALIQGQRDFFGAHSYHRVDNEGSFHTLWATDDRPEVEA